MATEHPSLVPATDIGLTTVVITAEGSDGVFDPALINLLEHDVARIKVIHHGVTRFDGSRAELAALHFTEPELAGEHPIERALRLITQPSSPIKDTP